MKWMAAALAALSAALTLVIALIGAGSGSASSPTVTITLPVLGPTTAVAPSTAQNARRLRAYAHRTPASAQAAISAGNADTVVAVANPDALPAVRPLVPAQNARLNGVSVWVPYWSPGSIATTTANAATIKVAHPFTDEITDSGAIVDQSNGGAAAMAAQLAAGGLAVVPTVTETAGMHTFATILRHPARTRHLLDALVSLGSAPHVNGIDLDFESLAYGHGNGAEAAFVARRYPVLVGRMCAALHALHRSCEVTVIAKNDAGHRADDGLDTGVYDYARLGAEADRIQVMAYDLHVPSGAAGPIAPWPWVRSVISYATTQIPAAKVVLGIPAYGYDWASDGTAGTLTAAGAEALAARVGAPVGWDAADAEPYFSYRVIHRSVTYRTRRSRHGGHPRRVRIIRTRAIDHTVWFDDATADYDRAVLAADDHLAGVAVWAAGDEDPRTWTLMHRISANN